MYIEDNAAEKRGKFREEENINSFMNIVDWEKLVKYSSTIECERDNDRGRDKFPNEKTPLPLLHTLFVPCAFYWPEMHFEKITHFEFFFQSALIW